MDADDLVALAVALGCTPNQLLMPDIFPGLLEEQDFALTEDGPKRSAKDLWAWATGEQPLEPGGDWMTEYMFVRDNRPQHFVPANVMTATAQVRAYERFLRALIEAHDDGLNSRVVRRVMELALDDFRSRVRAAADDDGRDHHDPESGG